MIDNIIEQILNSLKKNDPDFWLAALNVLTKLMQHGELLQTFLVIAHLLLSCIPQCHQNCCSKSCSDAE
jgi:hypothetical protein